ncbi:MAG: hypothetical protein AAF449_02760, partial [Myxococcota bacterium]
LYFLSSVFFVVFLAAAFLASAFLAGAFLIATFLVAAFLVTAAVFLIGGTAGWVAALGVAVDGDFLALAFLGTVAFGPPRWGSAVAVGMDVSVTTFSGFLVEVFWAFVAIDSSSCVALKS